jgi:RNAse (barnase) inhibitor barstar
VKRASIVFGQLYDPVSLSEEKTADFESLWDEMKGKILHREMGL